jgi:hypothetical protein
MLIKLFLFFVQGKSFLVAAGVATSIVVTTSVGAVVLKVVPPPFALPAHPADPLTMIVSPTVGAPVNGVGAPADGVMKITGWSIDRNTGDEDSTGVDWVKLYLDSLDNYLGDATLGDDLPAVPTEYEEFSKAGWHFDWTPAAGVGTGNHTLYALAHSKVTGLTSLAKVELNDPLVRINVPQPGQTVEVGSALEFAGWAIDRYEPQGPGTVTGNGVNKVELRLNGEFLVDVTPDESTPDVGEAYGARFDSAGWVHVWVADVPAGTYTLQAIAHSDVTPGRPMTASVEFEVIDPELVACGALGQKIGEMRGQQIQRLQSEWHQRHQYAMSYNGRIGSISLAVRPAYRDAIHGLRETVHGIRMTALNALHAHALDVVKPKCLDGTLTDYDLDGYARIVDEAVRQMDLAVAAAKPGLDAMAATTFTPPGGKP